MTLKHTNVHSMVTRAKPGVFKPKVYNVDIIPHGLSSVKKAIASPSWFHAMNDYYNTLLKNHTWSLTIFPLGAMIVGCKWVFNKYNVEGTFWHHKARSIAKRFNQTKGFNYIETFNSVVKYNTIRVVLVHGVNA